MIKILIFNDERCFKKDFITFNISVLVNSKKSEVRFKLKRKCSTRGFV